MICCICLCCEFYPGLSRTTGSTTQRASKRKHCRQDASHASGMNPGALLALGPLTFLPSERLRPLMHRLCIVHQDVKISLSVSVSPSFAFASFAWWRSLEAKHCTHNMVCSRLQSHLRTMRRRKDNTVGSISCVSCPALSYFFDLRKLRLSHTFQNIGISVIS